DGQHVRCLVARGPLPWRIARRIHEATLRRFARSQAGCHRTRARSLLAYGGERAVASMGQDLHADGDADAQSRRDRHPEPPLQTDLARLTRKASFSVVDRRVDSNRLHAGDRLALRGETKRDAAEHHTDELVPPSRPTFLADERQKNTPESV